MPSRSRNLGHIYRHRGLDEAEKRWDVRLNFTPDDPEVNDSIGMRYARQDKFERAAHDVEKAVRLAPGVSRRAEQYRGLLCQ